MRTPAAFALASLAAACNSTPTEPPPTDAGHDAAKKDSSIDAKPPPPWQGEAGVAKRAPVKMPLRELCGIASNPGDLPFESDPLATGKRDGYFIAAKDLGVTRIRRDFTWSEIEPSEGVFDFAPFDALVAEGAASSVRFLATPYGTPRWAASDPDSSANSGPRNTTDYATFAGKLAAHFAGKLVGYEIWNEESNGFRFWAPTLGGDPSVYGPLLVAGHDALRKADPSTPVVFGGCGFDKQLIPSAITFESAVFATTPSAAKAFEVMALHPYELYPPSTSPEYGSPLETPLVDKIEEQAWLLERNGAGGAPIWLTEIGWPVAMAAGVSEDEQARYFVRATIEAALAGADGVYWYTLRDGPNPTVFPPEDAFGLLRNDEAVVVAGDAAADGGTYVEATPKKAYRALKELLKVVGARWPSAAPPTVKGLPGDGHAVTFAGTVPGRVVALWTVTSTATVELAGTTGSVEDILGNSKGTTMGSVAIGPDPVYVVVP